MSRLTPVNPPELPPPRGFSQSMQWGSFIILSVQLPFTAQGDLVSSEFRTQCRQVFENMRTALEYQGAALSDLLKINVYLSFLENYDSFREVREEVLTPPFPASTLVGVTRLAYEQALVAIKGVAATGSAQHSM